MILSDTIKVKYKLNTCGLQTHEVAKLLREDIKRNRKIMEGLRNEDKEREKTKFTTID